MRTVDLIEAKRDGHEVPADQMEAFVSAVARGNVPDYQTAAFLMAVYFQGMTHQELVAYTTAMLDSGSRLEWPDLAGYKVDKHSTGGVGDKVSLALAPMVAACGPRIPMISGRGLGHTGGTLDKLEAIPGLDVSLSAQRFRQAVHTNGFTISGQTAEIAPADKKLYALRDVTATVPSIPLIAASIMSKKLAEGLDGLVLDVKVGSGAFMKTLESARELARTMIDIGNSMGTRTRAVLTSMDQPLGRAVGNANEVAEAIATLSGHGPDDFTEVCLALGVEMLLLAGVAEDADGARARLHGVISDGSALDAFRRFVKLQGGDEKVVDTPDQVLPSAPHSAVVEADVSGTVTAFDCAAVGRACGVLGGGRATAEDEIDHAVGIQVLVKVGDAIEAGQPLFELDYRTEDSLTEAQQTLTAATTIGDQDVEPLDLVLDVMR